MRLMDNENTYIAMVAVLMMTYALIVYGQDSSFTVYPDATTTESISVVSSTIDGVGMGEVDVTSIDYASGTSTITSTTTGNASYKVYGIRIDEEADTVASSTIVNNGVLSFYWNASETALYYHYMDATGTKYVGSLTPSTM